MKILQTILFVLIPTIVLSSCVTMDLSDHVFPSVGEYFRWNIRKFIHGDTIKYAIDNDPFFKLEEPYHQLGDEHIHPAQNLDIIALRAYDIPETGAWTNDFAVMGFEEVDQSIDWVIYYAEGKQTLMNQVPKFQKKLTFMQNKPFFKCFDLEYVDKDTFLVDCMERQPEQGFGNNYVIFVYKNETEPLIEIVPNHKAYDIVSDRKVQYHIYDTQNIGEGEQKLQRILLRGQYAYGTPGHSIDNLDGDCIIELLQNDEKNQIVDAMKTLTRGQLINDLKIPEDQHESFKFTLIDFKIMPNGDVYVLDAFNGIYVYYIKDDSTWKYKKKYDIGTEMAYAFDVNNKIDWNGISHLHIVVMHKNLVVEYVDGVQQKGFIGTFDAKHPSFIFASQQFIVVNTANTYYLYNSDHSFLIYTHQMSTKNYLVNPYEPDVVAISNSWTRRYEIGYARISVYSTVATLEENTVKFTASDASNNTCTASLKYQIIKQGDTNIYDVDHDPFPQVVTYPADPFFVQEMAAGPNLIYTNGDNSAGDHVIVDIHTVWELNIKGLVWPIVTDVTYADILIDPHWTDKTKFWFLFQHANKQVEIYECKAESLLSQNVDCENHAIFTLPNTLDSKVSQFDWYADEGDVLTIQFIEHDYQITFYSCEHDSSDVLFELKYEPITQNKISSFTVLKNGIYVVLPNLKQVDAWFGFFPNENKHIINQDTVKNQGSTNVFEPKKVFGNPAIKSEFILIQSKNCIFFGDMRNTFTLIYEFPILENAEVQVYLGIRTLFIIQKTNNAYKIDEWNYESLSNIYWMKTLPLYDRYQIQSPLTTDFCYETGYLFIRALDTKLQQTVILVYESEVLTQLSLHKVVNTHLHIPDGVSMSMAAAGHEQMYMYVNNKDSVQKMVGFLKDAIMTITPSHLSNQYVTSLNATVNITNQEVTTPKKISYPVKFINTQTYVTIDQAQLTKANSKFVFVNQTADQYIDISTDGWQNGQVIKYKADCEQCESHLIEIVNPVYHITDGSQYSQKFVAGVATGTRMLFQTTDSIIFQDEKGDWAGTYKLPISGSYNDCMSITASDDGKLVFSGCLDQSNVFIYLSFCDGKTCIPAEPKYRQISNGAKYPSKLLYKDGILFILDNNHDRPTLYDGSIRVHKVTLDEANKSWTLDSGVVINSKYLSTETSIPFQPSDFDVIKYEVGNFNYYKILTTSALYRIYFIDFYFDNSALKFVQHDKFDLFELIQKKFVLKIDTRFYQVRALKQTIKDKHLLCSALISTNNLATYAITFQFDINDPANKGSPVSNTATVPYLLSNYGTWTNLNKMAVFEDHAALAYTDNVNILAAVYKLPAIDHSSRSEEIETKIITLIGGEKDQQYTHITTYFVLTLSKDATLQRPVLHTNLVYSIKAQETLLLKYGVTDYPRLFIQKGNTIKEQEVYITAMNDYNTAHGVLKLTKVSPGPGPVPPGPDPDDDKSGGSHWVLITILCIVGVIVLAIGGYFLYTKVIVKKNNNPLHVQSY